MKQKNVDSHEKTLKDMKQKEKWTGAENFENRFYVIFDRYYKDFVSGENTGQQVIFTPNFDIFLIF